MSYQDKKKEKEKKVKDVVLEFGKECPDCCTVNESEAKFCGECGYDFCAVKRCSKCGAKVLQNADICEACGEWLLEGQCKFCYAPLEPEAKFCSECGNPADGIECPHCHRISYFDFCKDCNIPLTKQARETIEAVKNSEEFQSILVTLEESQPFQIASPEKEELEKMRGYKEKIEQSNPKKKIFSLSNKNVSKIDKIIQVAQEMKREQSKKEEEKSQVVEQYQQKSFANNQEARRFYGALKMLIPQQRRPIGWRCYAYDCVHPNGPHECSAPSGGGEWLYDKPQFKEVEI